MYVLFRMPHADELILGPKFQVHKYTKYKLRYNYSKVKN